MFYRAAVIALLGSILVMGVNDQVRLAQHDYATRHAMQHAHAEDRASGAHMRALGSARLDTQIVDVRRDELDRALAANGLASQARFVPVVRDGQPSGLKVYAVQPGSMLQALGLRNGDTLLAVNDLPVADAGSAVEAYATLRAHPGFLDLDVRRNGEQARIIVLLHE